MEKNKLDAESKVIAKKFGADRIGHSWMKALQAEFKKPYIDTVSITMKTKHNYNYYNMIVDILLLN